MWNDYGFIRAGRSPDYQPTPIILLSNTEILDTATIGSTVGILSAIGIGNYKFTFTSNPGNLFAISGSNLNVAAAITGGSYSIFIKADNGSGSATQRFVITVLGDLRITDTGDVRVTNTGDSRTVS